MIFCRHDWEVKVDRETPSPFDLTRDEIKSMSSAPPWFFERERLVVMACTKCGKVKVIR
jgi:hypothetical protein